MDLFLDDVRLLDVKLIFISKKYFSSKM